MDVGISRRTNTIYVVNAASDSISVIDGFDNKVVAGVTFHLNPFNSGYIECSDGSTTNSKKVTIGQIIYVEDNGEKSRTVCTAKPYSGFEFVSWQENLGDNSTQVLTFPPPRSFWDSHVLAIANFPQDNAPLIMKFLQGNKSVEPEAKLEITKFGTFTANFRESPPAVPPEFWIQTYVLIGTIIAGLSIPTILGWIGSNRDVRKSILYEKIFRKRIDDAVNNKSAIKKPRQEQLDQIRNEVEAAYSEGKIIEKHYNLLNKAISNRDGKERDNPS